MEIERTVIEVRRLRPGEGDLGRLYRLVEVVSMSLVQQRADQRTSLSSDTSQDRRDAWVGHQQAHRARSAELIEEPVGQRVEAEPRAYDCLEDHSIEQLTADPNACR